MAHARGWDGSKWAQVGQRFLDYAEGRTGDGAAGAFELQACTRSTDGDYSADTSKAPVPFAFGGRASILDQEVGGREVGEQLAVTTRTPLDLFLCYLFDGEVWTVDSRSAAAGGGVVAAYKYTLTRHV